MDKITEFNRVTCTQVRDAVEVALQDVADRFGITIEMGRGSFFGPDRCTLKVECVTTSDDGAERTAAGLEFRSICHAYNLEADDLGAIFETTTGKYMLIGANGRARKYPLLGKCVRTGKVFKFSPAMVAGHFVHEVYSSESGDPKTDSALVGS